MKDRLSLVAGSTACIDYAIAEALASEGARVIINGRSQESVDKAIAKVTPRAAGDLFNIENLVLRARSESDGFAVKDCELFWSTGVLEYWSVGKS